MQQKAALGLIFFMFSLQSLQAQLATFTFNDVPYTSATGSHVNLSVGTIQPSAGTISTNVTTGAYFTDEPYIEATGGWALTNEADAKYFFVEITAQL
jgi:hypothetical protein